MPDDLYQRDALAWADRQAELLRRLAAGERLNEAVDWPHVIEEVQDVGLSELRACESLIEQAMAHLLKLHAMPASPAVPHWRDEVRAFLNDMQRRFTPSMRQRFDLPALYRRALGRARGAVADVDEPAATLPTSCPFVLDELLEDTEDLTMLLARLAEGGRDPH